MQLRRLILALFLFGTAFGLSAQDVHYTLHNMSPLWLNPANTGAFYGSIRVTGHYRADWLGHSGINTPNISIDAPIIKGFRKQDWIGGGFNLNYDQANNVGTNIVRTNMGFSGAYHLSLDKKQTNVLTLGVQYGMASIGVIERCGTQGENIEISLGGAGGNCETFGSGADTEDNPTQNYTDINAGLMYRTVLDTKKENELEVGLAWQHITSDNYQSFVDTSGSGSGEMGGSSNIESRSVGSTIHAHATADLEVSDNIRFMPTAFYQSSRGNSTLSLQAWAGLQLKNEMMFKFGLGYRTGDAGKLLLGFQKDKLQIAASYDVVLSQQATFLSQSRNGNAVEIAANYIFNIYKKPEPKPSILCPRL